MPKTEIYFSCDIEADGPIPGPHSMLSFGVVAFSQDGKELSDFTRNLVVLPDAGMHPDTAGFWERNPEAYAKTQENQVDPREAMGEFVKWVEDIATMCHASPVFVGYPAGFDWTFMYWYMMKFVGRSPFGFQALDMKTFAMVVLGLDFRQTAKKKFPKAWFDASTPHTHVALEDAREQGHMFIRMLKQARTCTTPPTGAPT